MQIPVFTVDAFTNQPFSGNPAAVCLLENVSFKKITFMRDCNGIYRSVLDRSTTLDFASFTREFCVQALFAVAPEYREISTGVLLFLHQNDFIQDMLCICCGFFKLFGFFKEYTGFFLPKLVQKEMAYLSQRIQNEISERKCSNIESVFNSFFNKC